MNVGMLRDVSWLGCVWAMCIAFACGAVLGCAEKDDTNSNVEGDAAAEVAAEPVGPPPSDEQCVEFAERLAEAMRTADVSTFNRLIDWESIFRRCEAGLSLNAQDRLAFRTEVTRRTGGPAGLVGSVASAVDGGADFRYLRTRSKGGRKSVLMRFSADDGINYLELWVVRRADGEVVATDYYDYLSGERFTEGVRRGTLIVATESNRSLIDRLVGSESDAIRHAEDIDQLANAIARGAFAEGMDIVRNMPTSLQQEKFILLQRMACAQRLSDDEYLRAMEDLRKHYPNDPCIDFISIDAHILRGELTEALACIDRLDRAVGGDACLETMRADIHLQQGDYASARAVANKAIAGGEHRSVPFGTLILASLREAKHEETLDLLKRVAQRFDIYVVDIEANPEYAQFIATPQYQSWREFVATRAENTPAAAPGVSDVE